MGGRSNPSATSRGGACCSRILLTCALLMTPPHSKEVIWLDCDVFPIRDPSYLFEEEHFLTTGASFWGDVEGHYHPDRVVRLLDVRHDFF